jgi:flagellar FliL protein
MSKAAAASPESTTSSAGPAPKKRGKKLLFIILGVVVLALGSVGGFIITKRHGNAQAGEAAKEKHVEKKPSVFTALDPFTVNLADREREHYLQIGLTYELAGDDVAEEVKAQMPLIRSKILLLLTAKTAAELSTPEGKARLASELVTLARAPLEGSTAPNAKGPTRGIADVHYSAFIIQ